MIRTGTLLSALVLLAAQAATGQNETPDKVRFYEELGLRDFLENEPDTLPPPEPSYDDSPQKSVKFMPEATDASVGRFAFHVTPTQHFMGLSFENDVFTRFYKTALGADASLYLHLDRKLDVFASFHWIWFTGSEGDIAGLRYELADFNLYTLLLGIRPYANLSQLLGAESEFLEGFVLNLRFGIGAASFDGAWRVRPAPEQWFWSPCTIGVLHAGIGLEVKLLEINPIGEVSLMAEQSIRFHTPPAEYSASRPHNEIGPFTYAMFQAGLFFRMRFS